MEWYINTWGKLVLLSISVSLGGFIVAYISQPTHFLEKALDLMNLLPARDVRSGLLSLWAEMDSQHLPPGTNQKCATWPMQR